MDLKPVIWISSANYLESYYEIFENSSFKNRLFFKYPMPDDFPQVFRQPLTYFSIGEISFGDELLYNSNEIEENLFRKYFTGTPHNLKEVSFVLKPSEIKSIDWYHFQHPTKSYVKLEWIRIICNKEIMGGDFLIRVDSVSNTQKLFEMLNQFNEDLEIKTELKDLSDTKILSQGYLGLILLLFSVILNIYVNATENFNAVTTLLLISFLISGFIVGIRTMAWFTKNFKESSKAIYHGSLFSMLFSVPIIINILIDHFYL